MASRFGLIEKLKDYPFFTVNDVAKLIGRSGTYPCIFLHRLVKRGIVKRIARGKYTAQDDPFTFASSLYPPSYLGLWSALRFHDMTTQLPRIVFVLTARKRAEMEFGPSTLKFLPTRHLWGFERHNHQGFQVLVSDREKTVVDCLLTGLVAVDEVFDAMKSAELDEGKLAEYALKTNSKALAQRLGFLMEKAGMNAEPLMKMRGTTTIPLERGVRKGARSGRWRVVYDEVIFYDQP